MAKKGQSNEIVPQKVTNVTGIKKEEIPKALDAINEIFRGLNFLPLDIVKPEDCVPAELNARYMSIETMRTLVENIKRDGRLESVPLVYIDPSLPAGKYRIISGHHRIESAKEAGVEYILVMVASDLEYDEAVSKQLAHNALTGIDDKQILARLFESIKDLSLKFATGLNSAIGQVQYETLNFRVGSFKQFTVLFLPTEVEEYDEACRVIEQFMCKATDEIRIVPLNDFEVFKSAIFKIKKTQNIKSNAVALAKMVELAMIKLNEDSHEVEF